MAEYHVGCGVFAIYAGTLNSKNKSLWRDKTECTDEALKDVEKFPTIDPESLRPQGEWVFVEQRFYHGGFANLFRCSECTSATDREHNYCPNCGARMKGADDHA